ncbi:MAG TPA: penicillin-binding transpeptidase domain-containing protein [Streptosporangiaceae bacterium]
MAAAAGAVVLLGVALALGGGKPDVSAEPTVQLFLTNWANARYKTAAAQTTGKPAQVAAALAGLDQQLDADDLALAMGPIRQQGDSATARFRATVNLGFNGASWTYDGHFALRRLASGWKVLWQPSVVVPGLRPGLRLAVVSSVPPRAPLLDSAGQPLTQPALTYVIGVYPGKLADQQATAARLARATGIDSAELLSQLQVAPAGRFLKLARLSPADYDAISARLSRVPGLIVRQQDLRLFDSIASPVTGAIGAETSGALRDAGIPYRPGATVGLSGLQQAYQRTLVGTPTTKVVTEDRAGKVVSVLHRWTGKPGTPVRTTINRAVQQAANQAVGSVSTAATIVAIRPATGQILAVANHAGPHEPVLQPLAGHYQPGQAFTIVSTAALLARGFSLDTPIPCLPANPIGGESFVNLPPVPDLGTQPPFQTDFAHACRTAFAGLSYKLTGKQLLAAARSFGLGADWQLPLNGVFAGSMRQPAGIAELAADSVGNGTVLASPLQMAVIAGAVASGRWHAPSLVTSQPDLAPAGTSAFSSQVVQNLRTLMRATVTSGAGRPAGVSGQAVYGQVGTATLGPAPGTTKVSSAKPGKAAASATAATGKWASWFVGYRDGVAFAVLEVTSGPSNSAASVAGAFLHGFPAGS